MGCGGSPRDVSGDLRKGEPGGPSAPAETVHVDRSQAAYRYDPALPARVCIIPGTTVEVETRDPRSGGLLVGPPGTLCPFPPWAQGVHWNALTGPIAVQGASPGDTLVVDILEVAVAGVGYMAYNDEGSVVPRGRTDGQRVGIVDVRAGEVHWRNGLRWPCRPMCGCVGVAAHGAPPADATGAFGGNMDHAAVERGCRVYLPVFVPGAMLYVGDCHASMGDGELSGAGVEIAGNVLARIDCLPGVQVPGPRLETASHVTTTGWGIDFREARRVAVEAMLELMQVCLDVPAGEALMLISAMGDLQIGQSSVDRDMTLRLAMPRHLGLWAAPGTRR